MNRKRSRVASAIFVLMLASASESSFANVETASELKPGAAGRAESVVASTEIRLTAVGPKESAAASTSNSSPVLVPNAPQLVPASTASEDALIVPWNAMNMRFREDYSKSRLRQLEKLGPIVILREGKMIMRYKGEVQTLHVIPQRYTLLKSVSHIPLAIFVILDGRTNAPLSSEAKQELSAFSEFVDKAAGNIGDWKLSAESLSRQKQTIQDSKNFIDTALKNGSVKSDELRKFARAMAPLVLETAYEATSMELDLIDAGLKSWKEKIPVEDWNRLHVAIMQPHMPRNENRTMLYFEKMLKQPYEGERIIYCEGSSDEEYAVNLIGTHVLDKHIAVDFFKDPWRMHRDLLGDAAKRYLKKHRPLE